jgi:hypothetical protein
VKEKKPLPNNQAQLTTIIISFYKKTFHFLDISYLDAYIDGIRMSKLLDILELLALNLYVRSLVVH